MQHRLLTLFMVLQFGAVPNIAEAQGQTTQTGIAQEQPVSFEHEVLPLLEKRCNKCHHADESQGGLDLSRVETIQRGGDELGAAIVSGKPELSPLIQVLTGQAERAMPSEGAPLPEAEIALLSRWIQEGAEDDTPQFSRSDVEFFEKEIRPVLVKRCFKCHAGDDAESGLRLTSRHGILAGGSRGPAATTRNPDSSLILKVLRHEGDLRMPKGGDPLSDAQVAMFAEWVKRGLPWPRNQPVIARRKLFTISDADRDHWAFRSLPESVPAEGAIDRILQRKHQSSGLVSASKVDRHRLLRRVTYDLIGYPPTPAEVDAFINDSSPDAFKQVVNRLLASPQFGWRWGRHWLDYSRNGANGLPNRGPTLDAQRYASWVTKCFNEDRPWDWFAKVHLAGDRMPGFDGDDYSIDQALAAAVPLNGPRTFQEISTDTFVLMDKLDESIEFMGRSLMGISLECARCHDHKFDPISQRDYYGLLGFFQSSSFGPVPTDTKTRTDADAAVANHRELIREQARLSGLIRRASTKLNVRGGGRTRKWEAARQAVLAPKEKRLLEIEFAILNAELKDAERSGIKKRVGDLEETLDARKTALSKFKPRHFYVVSIKELGYFIHGHKSERGLIERAAEAGLTDLVPEIQEQDQFWTDEMARFRERQRFGGFAKSDPEVSELARWDDQLKEIAAQLTANSIQPWNTPSGNALFVRCEGGWRRAEELAPFDAQAKAAGIQLNSNNPLRGFFATSYVGDARLLDRGDVLYPEELVPRGTPEFFGDGPRDLAGSGRLQLAEWLIRQGSLQQALVARATVNRAWQHLFGTALCRTPKELGRLGEQPELPELVDNLAITFIQSGWSMKSLIRQIVLSDAYQRSSSTSETAPDDDPDNRLFARQNVRRLESEAIMNTMAWFRHGQRFETPDARDAKLMGAPNYQQQFDGPSKDDLIDRRVASISASQALFMMNSSSTSSVITSNHVGRLGEGASNGLLTSLPAIYGLILQRPPSPAESKFAEEFVERRRTQTGSASPQVEVSEFVRLLLCSNEVIYIE